MTNKDKYSEYLKNPLWQKKRLKIFERDSFACRCCLDSKSELHVHHIRYEQNKKPWEYPNKKLLTVCLKCHKSLHDGTSKIWDGTPLTLISDIGGQDISVEFHNNALKWFKEQKAKD